MEAGIARCWAKLGAYHRIASRSAVNIAYLAVNLRYDRSWPATEAANEKGDPDPALHSKSEPCQDMALGTNSTQVH